MGNRETEWGRQISEKLVNLEQHLINKVKTMCFSCWYWSLEFIVDATPATFETPDVAPRETPKPQDSSSTEKIQDKEEDDDQTNDQPTHNPEPKKGDTVRSTSGGGGKGMGFRGRRLGIICFLSEFHICHYCFEIR